MPDSIQINEDELVAVVNQNVYDCLMEYKESDLAFPKSDLNITYEDIPVEVQTELLHAAKIIAQQHDVESMHEVAIELSPSEKDGLDLLEQYVIRLSNIDDKEDIRAYTEELNKAIDQLEVSAETTEYLKTMVTIAENSYSLWGIEN